MGGGTSPTYQTTEVSKAVADSLKFLGTIISQSNQPQSSGSQNSLSRSTSIPADKDICDMFMILMTDPDFVDGYAGAFDPNGGTGTFSYETDYGTFTANGTLTYTSVPESNSQSITGDLTIALGGDLELSYDNVDILISSSKITSSADVTNTDKRIYNGKLVSFSLSQEMEGRSHEGNTLYYVTKLGIDNLKYKGGTVSVTKEIRNDVVSLLGYKNDIQDDPVTPPVDPPVNPPVDPPVDPNPLVNMTPAQKDAIMFCLAPEIFDNVGHQSGTAEGTDTMSFKLGFNNYQIDGWTINSTEGVSVSSEVSLYSPGQQKTSTSGKLTMTNGTDDYTYEFNNLTFSVSYDPEAGISSIDEDTIQFDSFLINGQRYDDPRDQVVVGFCNYVLGVVSTIMSGDPSALSGVTYKEPLTQGVNITYTDMDLSFNTSLGNGNYTGWKLSGTTHKKQILQQDGTMLVSFTEVRTLSNGETTHILKHESSYTEMWNDILSLSTYVIKNVSLGEIGIKIDTISQDVKTKIFYCDYD